jgi:hypothetical protein
MFAIDSLSGMATGRFAQNAVTERVDHQLKKSGFRRI